MDPILTSQEIDLALYQVQHPEIRFSLVELQMFNGAQIEGNQVVIDLALPTVEVPQAIRDYLRASVVDAVQRLEPKAECSVRFVNMSEDQRQTFLALAREGWIE